MRAASAPPTLYAWDIESGEGGVTDDLDAAVTNVDRALRGAVAGAGARIRMVVVSTYGTSEYIELGVVGEARREGGGVVWMDR
ncbi:hypothetical protein GCM10022254_54810 [Actinomadura meridiana]|uniref:Uncharacterized protein n=1 Tax=Actinomadura meridiana TaxID=559626 RepID=A0ABP8CFE3_9ACTN